ncbi:hypothetical protein N7535_002763 [Penicillium sp. DV-2018c]|nr:hypothetical protein N7535_002763 [Penicillium sp. DV-2018c]
MAPVITREVEDTFVHTHSGVRKDMGAVTEGVWNADNQAIIPNVATVTCGPAKRSPRPNGYSCRVSIPDFTVVSFTTKTRNTGGLSNEDSWKATSVVNYKGIAKYAPPLEIPEVSGPDFSTKALSEALIANEVEN